MSTPPERLGVQAQDFAARLRALLNGTVTSGATVSVFEVEDSGSTIIGPGPDPTGPHLVPLSSAASRAERDTAKLWLKLFYKVRFDDEGHHMAIASSSFGLCINSESRFCPIRVEYDRDKTRKQPAHLQVHASSPGLSYAAALLGRPAILDLSKLHLPSGGRRFRPTIEDFIEFLHQEGLLPPMKSGWTKALEVGRADWEARQTKAAVRRNEDAAVEQLRAMGYTVKKPVRRRP